ncbi:MAG: hypothetical protein GJV46_13660 [Geobacter sp.]|nr:hypothetical protein [Geobacter sp.]
MNPKNKHPIELSLDKSSSGTWKMPGPQKRQFKPWQRLWIVSGAIYLLMLAGGYHLLMPDRESIERRMVFSVTEEVRRYDGMAYAGESPRKIFEIARSQGYPEWIAQVRSRYHIGPEGNAGFVKIEKEYREAISDLPVKRAFGAVICVFAWMVPMALLYGIGYAVDWIKRGAREIQGR